MEDGAAVIVLSIIGLITTIALYVLFPLPIGWKKWKHVNPESPQRPYFAVDIPFIVTLPIFCYNSWGLVNVLAMISVIKLAPFHYFCLGLSPCIGVISVAVYFYIFLMTQDIRWGGPLLLQQFLCLLFFLIPFVAFIIMFLIGLITGIDKLTGIVNTVLGITMYASPLPIVMNRRNMKTMQTFALWLSILFFFNAIAWFLVALLALPYDPYQFITNLVGALLGLVHFGIIVSSTWSSEIPRILKGWISLIRERGLCYFVQTIFDIQVNENTMELEPNETTESEKPDSCVEVIVQKDDALPESTNARPK